MLRKAAMKEDAQKHDARRKIAAPGHGGLIFIPWNRRPTSANQLAPPNPPYLNLLRHYGTLN